MSCEYCRGRGWHPEVNVLTGQTAAVYCTACDEGRTARAKALPLRPPALAPGPELEAEAEAFLFELWTVLSRPARNDGQAPPEVESTARKDDDADGGPEGGR